MACDSTVLCGSTVMCTVVPMTRDDATPDSALPEIGIMLPRDLPAHQILDFARAADDAGFDELWVVEDLGFRGGIAQASAALAVTSRIRVGVGILPASARNVAFTAMEAATLVDLFGDRLHLGIGHGMPAWMQSVGAWPESILTSFEDHVSALRALLSGESVSVDGRYVHLDAVQLEGGPRTAPPILAGVRGPRSLALAGRVADGTVLAEPSAPEYIAQARQQIGTAEHRVVAYNAAAVDVDAHAARQAVRPGLEWIGEPGWEAHLRPLPFADEIVALRARSASRADFVAALPDAWVDALTVSGTRDDARASLARMRAAGADCVVLQPVGDDPVQALASLASIL